MQETKNPLRIKFLTEAQILGEGRQVYWTNLNHYYKERDESITLLQKKYARKVKSKKCLVFEPIGTFL